MSLDQPTTQTTKRRHQASRLEDTALFQVTSLHELARLLKLDVADLRQACCQPRFLPTQVLHNGRRPKARNVSPPVGQTLVLHKRVLRLLNRVGRPSYLHSTSRGRSYVTNAAVHCRQRLMLTADIRRFFESTSFSHVYRFFAQDLRMATDLAGLLASLCTREGKLALGSPLSPLLSFLAHRSMFEQLARLSLEHQLQFTVYADDITFSGGRIKPSFIRELDRIVRMQGLELKSAPSVVDTRTEVVEITGAQIRKSALFVPPELYQRAMNAIAELHPGCDDKLLCRAKGYISAAHAIRRSAGNALRQKLDATLQHIRNQQVQTGENRPS